MRCYPHFTLARGRSPGFGSMSADYPPFSDSLSLRLRLFALTSPANITRRFILQKARRHTPTRAPTDCRHTVSGSLSLRSRGTFHLSLTVLSTIGRQGVFSLGRWSSRIPTGFLVSRGTWGHTPELHRFRLRGSHPLRPAFPCRSATYAVSHSVKPLQRLACMPRYPNAATAATSHTALVWAPPRSLATTCGITLVFFSSGY